LKSPGISAGTGAIWAVIPFEEGFVSPLKKTPFQG
jgi:hypothetical protein